jgi:hypothetical protein
MKKASITYCFFFIEPLTGKDNGGLAGTKIGA